MRMMPKLWIHTQRRESAWHHSTMKNSKRDIIQCCNNTHQGAPHTGKQTCTYTSDITCLLSTNSIYDKHELHYSGSMAIFRDYILHALWRCNGLDVRLVIKRSLTGCTVGRFTSHMDCSHMAYTRAFVTAFVTAVHLFSLHLTVLGCHCLPFGSAVQCCVCFSCVCDILWR